MKIKKTILSLTIALALLGLSACSNSSKSENANKNVVTMKGDTIQIVDVYNEATLFPSVGTGTLIQNLTFSKIFEKEFADEVTEEDVQKEYNSMKSDYGSSFESYLAQEGMTTESYKSLLRLQLLQQVAIEKKVEETEFTDAKLKKAWENYHPTVEAYVLSYSSEEEAKTARDSALNDLENFKTTQNSNGTSKKFDSSNTTINEEVRKAAFALKDGETSEIIPITDAVSGTSSYYVVHMISNQEKGDDMSKYNAQLKNYIVTQKESDESFVASVFKEYLTDYNVTVKETAYSNIFSNYLE
ncbi:MAG: foldase [Lactovum sp.]